MEVVVGWMWANNLKLNPEKKGVLCVPSSCVQEVWRQPAFEGAKFAAWEMLMDSALSLETQVPSGARSI